MADTPPSIVLVSVLLAVQEQLTEYEHFKFSVTASVDDFPDPFIATGRTESAAKASVLKLVADAYEREHLRIVGGPFVYG